MWQQSITALGHWTFKSCYSCDSVHDSSVMWNIPTLCHVLAQVCPHLTARYKLMKQLARPSSLSPSLSLFSPDSTSPGGGGEIRLCRMSSLPSGYEVVVTHHRQVTQTAEHWQSWNTPSPLHHLHHPSTTSTHKPWQPPWCSAHWLKSNMNHYCHSLQDTDIFKQHLTNTHQHIQTYYNILTQTSYNALYNI